MQPVTIQPAPGQGTPFGGTIQFWAPNSPSVNPGDQWFLTGVGMIPNFAVFASIPFATSQNVQQIGVTNPDGTFSAQGVAANPGSINGLVLARNWGNPFGSYESRFVAVGPQIPEPPPTPGIALLVSTVIAHRTSGAQPLIAPSNFIGGNGGLPQLRYDGPVGPTLVFNQPVPFVYALDDPSTALLASLLGASISHELPPRLPADLVDGTQPLVNFLKMPDQTQCCAGLIAQEILVNYLDAQSLTAVLTGMFT